MSAATIGSALAAKRDELGLAKGHAADMIGMSRTTYSSYEQDAQRPTVDVFPALAKFLDISMEELLALYGATCVAAVRSSLDRVTAIPEDARELAASPEGSASVVDADDRDQYVTPFEKTTNLPEGVASRASVAPASTEVVESEESSPFEEPPTSDEAQEEQPDPPEPGAPTSDETEEEQAEPSEQETNVQDRAESGSNAFDHSPFAMGTPKSENREKSSSNKKKKKKKRKKN